MSADPDKPSADEGAAAQQNNNDVSTSNLRKCPQVFYPSYLVNL